MSFGPSVRNGLGIGLGPTATLSTAFSQATLDFDFIDNLVFPTDITFTRASSATYFNSAGVLTTAGNNVPRLDYNPATLAARGLLIEEQRTNLLLQSQFASGWTAAAGTLTPNATASPNGTVNAASYIEDNTTATRYPLQLSQSFTAGATITASLFVKQTGGATRHFRIQVTSNASANGFRAYFNLSTNAVAVQTASIGTGSAVTNSATITAVGNGWYRISASGTVDPAATTASAIGFMQDTATGSASYTGDGTSGLYIWGAQLEAGAFPTSYIPTTTAAATRSADVATVATLTPWYNATEGTIFVEAQSPNAAAIYYYYSLNNGTTNEIRLGASSSGTNPTFVVTNASSTQASIASILAAGTAFKAASAYGTNSFNSSVNGGIGTRDTTGTPPTAVSLRLGARSNDTLFTNGHIRRFTYYPINFSDAQLQALTA